MRQALAVAAKAPRPGTVKTRLHSLLSVTDATELYRCFLKDTLSLMESVSGVETIVSYTPAECGHCFEDIISNKHRLLPQRGDLLGERLHHAIEDILSEGFDSLAIIGADSPTLPREYLAQAFEELARPGDRLVLGPTLDGGYYLIGMKRPHRRLFEEITWSSERVLTDTLERAREIALEIALLPEWYDVDDVAEFERLRRDIIAGERVAVDVEKKRSFAANTRRFISSRWPMEEER